MSNDLIDKVISETLDKAKKDFDDKIKDLDDKLNNKIKDIQDNIENRTNNLDNIVSGKPLSINFGSVQKPDNKTVHKDFYKVLKVLESTKRIQKNIMLVGPTGSGKTVLCDNIAEALKLKFYPMSVGLQTTKSDLLGYMNANGVYVSTPVREAFENGGVLLLDEFDSTNANTVTILSSMLANGICSFPDKIVSKNDNFICMVACNTYGRGGSVEYIGRNRLDTATLDRFVTMYIDYDEELEDKLTNNTRWLNIIRKIRENINLHGIKMAVSPRASMQGADLLENGFSTKEVLDMCVFKGVTEDVKTKLLQGVDFNNIKNIKEWNDKNTKNANKLTIHIDLDEYFVDITGSSDEPIPEIAIQNIVDWNSFYNIFIGEHFTSSLSHNKLFIKGEYGMTTLKILSDVLAEETVKANFFKEFRKNVYSINSNEIFAENNLNKLYISCKFKNKVASYRLIKHE